MTLMAKLDTTKNPPVVIDIYNYSDPSYMTGAAWIDVTYIDPPAEPGCTYNSTTKAWTYPSAPEDMVAWAHQQMAINEAFLALGNPTALQTEHQCQALTYQVNRVLLRRQGGV